MPLEALALALALADMRIQNQSNSYQDSACENY